MKHIKILSALLLSILVASCNQGSSTTDNGGSSGSWMVPGVGTEFVYTTNFPDSVGNPIIDTLEYTVTSTGQQVAGKSNAIRVSLFAAGLLQQGQSAAYVIESNDDISLDDSIAPNNITWKTYPTGSHQTITDPPIDSFSFGEQTITTDVRSFIGSGNISTAAGNFSTVQVQEIMTTINIDTSASFSDTSVQTDEYWFAPSIGFLVKQTETETDDGQPSGFNQEFDLIKYLPK